MRLLSSHDVVEGVLKFILLRPGATTFSRREREVGKRLFARMHTRHTEGVFLHPLGVEEKKPQLKRTYLVTLLSKTPLKARGKTDNG